MQTSDSIVIIPTYNERENIENIIRAVFGLPPVSYTHLDVYKRQLPKMTFHFIRTKNVWQIKRNRQAISDISKKNLTNIRLPESRKPSETR